MASQAFHRFTYHLPPPAETLAILVGCLEVTIFGLGGLANIPEFAKAYGLPLVATTFKARANVGPSEMSQVDAKETAKEDKRQEAWIMSTVARNIQNGCVILALGLYVRDRRALGIAMVANLITTTSDALIVSKYGVEETFWGHVFGMANSVLIGGSLLYWKRGDPWW